MPPEIFIICESIHTVLALERALVTASIPCDLVPMPRALHSDCGMALTLRGDDFDRAATLLRERAARIVGVYLFRSGQYEPIGLPGSIAGG